MPRDAIPGIARSFAIFAIFLRLGLTSFGGPIAHLGYFRREFVERRRWIGEDGFADLVALCQFLPGPASSQLGFALGLAQGGWPGALAAWAGFTLPSALAMFLLALFSASWRGPMAGAAIHGLKIVAVAVVAQALWGMARALTPDLRRAAIALVATAVMLQMAGSLAQIAAILFGALAGLVLCRGVAGVSRGHLPFAISRPAAGAAIAVFTLLLLGLPLLTRATGNHVLAVFDAFYRTGALVFGGGHVVLPLLRDAIVTPGWIAPGNFLSGYGAAQALPGPLFTVAAYLGAAMSLPPNGIAGAGLALVAIFLPGMLVLCGALPFWNDLRADRRAQAAMRGINAAVVGLLAAALYDPLWTGAITNGRDLALGLGGFLMLTFLRLPSLFVVIVITGSALLLV